MTNLPRRGATRYQLRVPVSFWWSSPGAAPRSGEGFTRDISISGMWIESDARPVLGAAIEVSVLLPAIEGGEHRMRLVGEGTVVWLADREIGRGQHALSKFGISVQLYAQQADNADPAHSEQLCRAGDTKQRH